MSASPSPIVPPSETSRVALPDPVSKVASSVKSADVAVKLASSRVIAYPELVRMTPLPSWSLSANKVRSSAAFISLMIFIYSDDSRFKEPKASIPSTFDSRCSLLVDLTVTPSAMVIFSLESALSL